MKICLKNFGRFKIPCFIALTIICFKISIYMYFIYIKCCIKFFSFFSSNFLETLQHPQIFYSVHPQRPLLQQKICYMNTEKTIKRIRTIFQKILNTGSLLSISKDSPKVAGIIHSAWLLPFTK